MRKEQNESAIFPVPTTVLYRVGPTQMCVA